MAEARELAVYLVPAERIPTTLLEIGRSREEVFRAVGEGTGKPLDLDPYDLHYLHLVLWDRGTRRIAGGYRLGRVRDRVRRGGPGGLYLHTLFEFGESFVERLGDAVELGRSFVAMDYQRGFAPLLLLWRGIGGFLARNPTIRNLVGPVSISADYDARTRAVIATWLELNAPSSLGALVHPRHPFVPARIAGRDVLERARFIPDLKALDAAVSVMEDSHGGMPVLLRRYLELGAEALAFNVDPAFRYSVDVLCVLDVLRADPNRLRRFMGAEAHSMYHANRPGRRAAIEQGRC